MSWLSTPAPPPGSKTPSLNYSSPYWGARGKRDLLYCAEELALILLEYNNHISTEVLSKTRESYFYAVGLINKYFLFKGLHCASVFGIVEITAGSGGGML